MYQNDNAPLIPVNDCNAKLKANLKTSVVFCLRYVYSEAQLKTVSELSIRPIYNEIKFFPHHILNCYY